MSRAAAEFARVARELARVSDALRGLADALEEDDAESPPYTPAEIDRLFGPPATPVDGTPRVRLVWFCNGGGRPGVGVGPFVRCDTCGIILPGEVAP